MYSSFIYIPAIVKCMNICMYTRKDGELVKFGKTNETGSNKKTNIKQAMINWTTCSN